MLIKKSFQGEIPENKIMNDYTETNTDAYSCEYINEKTDGSAAYIYNNAELVVSTSAWVAKEITFNSIKRFGNSENKFEVRDGRMYFHNMKRVKIWTTIRLGSGGGNWAATGYYLTISIKNASGVETAAQQTWHNRPNNNADTSLFILPFICEIEEGSSVQLTMTTAAANSSKNINAWSASYLFAEEVK